ncbi:ribonuclease E/G [Paracoccaceae bacterium GXU_MW_L88]
MWRVLIDELPDGRAIVARMRGTVLEDLLVDSKDDTPQIGAIYRGKVDRLVKGMGGAMLRLPDGQSAFLKEAKGMAQGDMVTVQITTHAEPGKAQAVTPRPLFKSRYAIVTPHAPGINIARKIKDEAERDRLLELGHEGMEGSDFGLILRSASDGADSEALAEDIFAMRDLAEAVMQDQASEPSLLVEAPDAVLTAWRDWTEPSPERVEEGEGTFETADVWSAIAALETARAQIGTEAWMEIQPTRALTAVDVNTGGDFSPAATLKANLAAARNLPRQLRLRGLGGVVTVDFAPLAKRDRSKIEGELRAALKADGIDTVIAGWTPLGLLELQRKRERRPLSELL